MERIPFEGHQRHLIPLDELPVVNLRPLIRLVEPLKQLIHSEELLLLALNDNILLKGPFGLVPTLTTPYSTAMSLVSIGIDLITPVLIVLV